MSLLLLNNEIYRFLLYDYLHRVGRCVDVREGMTVDAYWRILWHFYGDVMTSVWENHLVIEDSATQEKGNDGEQAMTENNCVKAELRITVTSIIPLYGTALGV